LSDNVQYRISLLISRINVRPFLFSGRLVPFLENTVAHASVLTLVAIGIERYRVICRPLRGIRDDFIKSAKVVPLLWLLCATSNIPWFYIAVFRDSRHLDGTPIKVCRIPMVLYWQKMYATLQFALFFVTPFLVLLILYCIICNILYSTQGEKDINSMNNSQHSCCNRRRVRLQVINIIICLVLLFFIFHLPYRIVSMWFTFAERHEIHSLGIERYYNLLYSVRILFYLNHAMNPIIYNFVSTKFRTALRIAFTRREHRGSLMSSKSNRKGNYNTPFTKPKQSQMLLVNKEMDNELNNHDIHIHHNFRSSSSSSSSRQKMNEFYPMYSHIIEKQCDAQ